MNTVYETETYLHFFGHLWLNPSYQMQAHRMISTETVAQWCCREIAWLGIIIQTRYEAELLETLRTTLLLLTMKKDVGMTSKKRERTR